MFFHLKKKHILTQIIFIYQSEKEMNKFLNNHYFKLIAILGSSYLVYKTLRIYLNRRKYRHLPGPPTNGILGFYFGNVIDMPKYLENGKIFNQFLLEWLLF